jgi:serine/threonine protein kinase
MNQVLDKYQLEGQIGSGSFSKIYLGKDKKTGAVFAVKHTNKRVTKPKNYQREVDVFRILEKTPHPNIIATHEILEDDEDVFIIQEYVPSGNLLNYLANHAPMNEAHIKRVFVPIIAAMEHLHVCGISHRDIKLENILVTAEGVPKIIDFNLACFWSPEVLQRSFCGSQEYCSPEIFLRKPYIGPESDVWSLGVLLYTLLFCEFPFKPDNTKVPSRNNPNLIADKVINCTYKIPANHSASSEAVEIVRRIFISEGAQRPTLTQLLTENWFQPEIPVAVAPVAMAKEYCSKSVSDFVMQDLENTPAPQEKIKEEAHEGWVKQYYKDQYDLEKETKEEGAPKIRERSYTTQNYKKNIKGFWTRLFRVGKSLQY